MNISDVQFVNVVQLYEPNIDLSSGVEKWTYYPQKSGCITLCSLHPLCQGAVVRGNIPSYRF